MTPAAAAHLRLESPVRQRSARQDVNGEPELGFAAAVDAEKPTAVGGHDSAKRSQSAESDTAGATSAHQALDASSHGAGEEQASATQDPSASRGTLTALLALQALEKGSVTPSSEVIPRNGLAESSRASPAAAEQLSAGLPELGALAIGATGRHGTNASGKAPGEAMPGRGLQHSHPAGAHHPVTAAIAVEVEHVETHFAPVGVEGLPPSLGSQASRGEGLLDADGLGRDPASRPGTARGAAPPAASVARSEDQYDFSHAPAFSNEVAEDVENRLARVLAGGPVDAQRSVPAAVADTDAVRERDASTSMEILGSPADLPASGSDRRDVRSVPVLASEIAEALRHRASRVVASGSATSRVVVTGLDQEVVTRSGEPSQRLRDAARDNRLGSLREPEPDVQPQGGVDRNLQHTAPAAANVGQQLFQAIAGASAPPDPPAIRHGSTSGAAHSMVPGIAEQHAQGAPVRVLKLALTPDDIGPVTIVIRGNASELSVRIEPAVVEAFAEVEAAREDLLQRLTSVGYQVTDIAVVRGQQSADMQPAGSGSAHRDASHQPTGEQGRQTRQRGEEGAGSHEQRRPGDDPAGIVAEGQELSLAPRGLSSVRHV